MTRLIALACIVLALPAAARGCGCPIDQDLVARAFSSDAAVAEIARQGLRDAGPLGLTFVDHQRRDQPLLASEAGWDALYDEVGQQRGDRASMLYWYTDLAQAEEAARAQGKPIVSLRMLGKLTDEYSCANSRFFRAVLYPDRELSAWMREHVILHWSSERPAPQVSIDLGDGRVLRTTIGGNSAHFVLTPDGRPVDVLPGLYGPRPFLEQLRAAAACATAIAAEPARRSELMRAFHERGLAAEQAELERLGIRATLRLADDGTWVATEAAEALTMSKALVERPLIRVGVAADHGAAAPFPPRDLARLVAAHPDFGMLDEAGRAVVEPQLAAMRELIVGGDTSGLSLAQVEAGLAQDTAINELALHAAVHRRLLGRSDEFRELDAWIYSCLFLTPAADPWLGLAPRAWDGIDRRAAVAVAAKR